MTQTNGQPAHMCEQNLLAAIKALGKEAKLKPLKTALNEKRETASCPFGTFLEVRTACDLAMKSGHVQKMGVTYALTSNGEARLSELLKQNEPLPT